MELLTLQCNQCGAPVQVANKTKFAQCLHCGASLAIHRTETAAYTDVVEKISETLEDLKSETEALKAERKLQALDKSWQAQQRSFEVEDKHGRRSIPTKEGSVIAGFMVAGFGLFWTVMAVGITSSAPSFGPFTVAKVAFPAFGIFFIGFGIFIAAKNYQLAERHASAARRYRQQRLAISKTLKSNKKKLTEDSQE